MEVQDELIKKMIKNYKYYQDKLLQVTQKNRSVLLKKIYAKHNFDLTQIEKIREGTIDKIVIKAIKNIASTLNDKKDNGESLNILPDSIDNDEAASARVKLKALSRNLVQIEEETGQQTGYLGFPFLQGHPNKEFYIRGPLVLFPISLEYKKQAKNSGWFLNLLDKRPILNGALIAALKKKGGYNPPENYEETFDDLIEEMVNLRDENLEEVFFKKVNNWINTIVSIDEAKNQIKSVPLNQLSRDDLEKLEKQSFHLVNYKIIGHFPQADNEIYKDYNELIKNANLLDTGVIGNLLDIENQDDESFGSVGSNIDMDDAVDSELNIVVASDSSQDEVILESKKSNLVVVWGPPGTGKSQVIVNLISDALTRDEKVLVVCQKRAALEVVKKRLGQVGLDKYVVFLEKELDDRIKIYSQLYKIIEEEPKPTFDSELTIKEYSERIDSCVQHLTELGRALRKQYFGGATAHKIYSKADGGYQPLLDLSSVRLELNWNDLDRYIQKIRNIEDTFKKIEDSDYPWFGRISFAKFTQMEKSRLHQLLQKLMDLIPKSILLPKNDIENLQSLFNTYLYNPGILNFKRKISAKKIEGILGIKLNETNVSEYLGRVNNGKEFWENFSNLLKFFDYKKQVQLESIVSDAERLRICLSEMQTSLSEFDSIQELDKKKVEYEPSIFEILSQAKTSFNKNDDWSNRIEQEIYAYWLSIIEQENPILQGDPVSNYDNQKNNLAKLIEEKKQVVVKTIQRKIEGVIHPKDMYGKNRTDEQKGWRAFSAELKKKRKVKPIRKLFAEFSSYFFKIAPCWLASPESVSKVFPLQRNLFDLVIVDEASQLAVERAIPFLYRAKRVVIAGDEKQLPPFDLFQIREDDTEDEELYNEKSLLELAKTRYKTINLSWHYRSEYQDLINFSNHAFYEGLLNVAPNATNNPKYPPIRWIKCNGRWENQTNAVEAKKVVDEIQNIWKRTSDEQGIFPSVGVITFNERQQDLIKDFIETRKDTDHNFLALYTSVTANAKKDETLFVKNIENVQGDERDIIIFSIGYAKGVDGRFDNFFGTLSMKGGENRLNVAITRARKEMVVISSIEPEDIKPTSTHDGPRRLRQFLQFAKATNMRNTELQKSVLAEINPNMEKIDESRKVEFDSEFEIQVYEMLKKRGYRVDSQIGFSGYKIDLAVIHPNDENRYILGIECDGATFHSAKSVRERDVMRQKFLEEKGWKIERIWSRNWWRNPTYEINRIEDRIKELMNTGSYTSIN